MRLSKQTVAVSMKQYKAHRMIMAERIKFKG